MDIIAETGDPYVVARTLEKGGAGDSGIPTALGVLSGIKAVSEFIFGTESLAGKRVLVQGTGSVGHALIDMLLEHGAKVLFSEIDQKAIQYFRDNRQLEFVQAQHVFDTPCDIFAPCALGGILNQETIPRLKCAAIAGSANNQLAEPKDAERLQERKILYAPDFIINAGGAIAIIGQEKLGWSQKQIDQRVKGIKLTLKRIFKIAATKKITTTAAAYQISESRLSKAKK